MDEDGLLSLIRAAPAPSHPVQKAPTVQAVVEHPEGPNSGQYNKGILY